MSSPVWEHVPPLPVVEKRVPLVVPWVLAVVPLWAQFERIYYSPARHWAMVIVAALFLVVIHWRPRWLAPAVVLGSAALVPWFGVGLAAHVAPLLFIPLTIWAFATGAVRPTTDRWPAGPVLYPSCVAVVVSAVSLYGYTAFRFAMVCLIAAIALAVGASFVRPPLLAFGAALQARRAPLVPWWERLVEALRTAGRGLGRVVGAVVMLPALALISLVWLGQRLFRVDPLQRSASSEDSSWSRRMGADPFPGTLFSGVRPVRPTGFGNAVRRFGATAAVVLLVLAVVAPGVLVGVGRGTGSRAARAGQAFSDLFESGKCSYDLPPSPAMDQVPHWHEIACETDEFSRNGRFDGVATYRIADFSGDYIHVKDGIRRTWRAPRCDCKRVKLWMFGGSAAFGWYQRDDHTPASLLAKEAWRHGIALDIEVRAMPGWIAGQEVRTFADLSTHGRQPDLALFYDGGNDLNRQWNRNSVGRGADESASSFAEEELNRLLAQGPFPWSPQDFTPLPPDEPGPTLEPEDVARHAMNRYRRDLVLARRVAAAAGVEPVFVWQPLAPASPLARSDPDALPPKDRVMWQKMISTGRARLPADVIDLTSALDGARGAVFKDVFHTNEYAAGLVAKRLFRELRPQLEEAAR